MMAKLSSIANLLVLFTTLTSTFALILPLPLNITADRISLRDATAIAVAHTTRIYPFATFNKIEATSLFPTSNPDSLRDVRLIFKGNRAHPIIVVTMRDWGHWAAPRFVDEDWPLDDAVLPYRLRLDVRDADALMKRAGYTGLYHALDVEALSIQGNRRQPWWIFQMEGERPSFVWVGDWDRRIVPDWRILRGIGDRNGSLGIVR